MRVLIELNQNEQDLADLIGKKRNGKSPDNDTKAFSAELAVARYLNAYPDLTTHQRTGGYDLSTAAGTRVDVKWTAGLNHHLVYGVDKLPDHCDVVVLVVGVPPRLEIIGWAYEKEVVQEHNIQNFGFGNVYAVPQEVLRDIGTLV